MEQKKFIDIPKHIDWNWVVLGVCIYIVFHFFVIFLFVGSLEHSLYEHHGGVMWSGIAIVSFIIAYRSRGITMFEPAISALLYMILWGILSGGYAGKNWLKILSIIPFALAGAILGEAAQWLMNRKANKTS
jgi:hypothetical protein